MASLVRLAVPAASRRRAPGSRSSASPRGAPQVAPLPESTKATPCAAQRRETTRDAASWAQGAQSACPLGPRAANLAPARCNPFSVDSFRIVGLRFVLMCFVLRAFCPSSPQMIPRWLRLETRPRLLPGVVGEHCSRRSSRGGAFGRLEISKYDADRAGQTAQNRSSRARGQLERTFRRCDDRSSISAARSALSVDP